MLLIGALWGLTLPLARVAVSTGHSALGLIVWEKVLSGTLLGVLVLAMRMRVSLSRDRVRMYFWVGVLGATLPGYVGFVTAAHLPAGVRAIIVASVPLFVLPIALFLGFERPDARRAVGVALGGLAVVLIASATGQTPGATLSVAMVFLALLGPLSYAIEGNYIAARGNETPHPFVLLFGAAIASVAITAPLALVSGETVNLFVRWGPAEWALAAGAALDVAAYSGYVWLVGAAGPVFASQIAYAVTGFGVIWSMALLGERYPVLVWGALAAMLAGLALVQPKSAGAKSA